jgi:pSer/pThr/pTyr-binding forkhead associated (FHA) protein
MKNTWTLKVVEPGQPSREVVAQEGMTIGRHPDCALVLTGSFVSGRHAQVVADGEALAIMDLGSNNGTVVGEGVVLRKGDKQVLKDGMSINMGGARMLVCGAGDGSETRLERAFEADMTIAAGLTNEARPAQPVAKVEPTPPPTAEPAPAPTPTPAPTPAPAPLPQTPAPPGHTESALGGTVFANRDSSMAGMQTKLDHMGARLLLLNEADLRVIELRSQETLIGRSTSADCSLANRGVSSMHAKIEFRPSGNLFFLKDLGSSNGTQVDGVPLDANIPHELSPDSYIRFGTVDALFLQSMDAGFHVVSSERHENAARLLTARGQIPSSVVKKAQEEAAERGVALGEVLLLGQHVEPREWARSVKDAQVASTLQQLTPVSSKRILFWVAVGLALGVTALMATSSGRALLGIGD